jgi:WD40 repeat protein
MMSSSTDTDRLLAYLHGELPADDAAALEERLKAEPALADALVRLAYEEAVLTEWAQAARAAAGEPGLPAGCPSCVPASRGRSRLGRRLALAAGALAALFALAAAWVYFAGVGGPAEAGPVAELEAVQGEVYVVTDAGRAPAAAGQGLFPGQGLRTEGENSTAVVKFPDATRLELGADTLIRLLKAGGPHDEDSRKVSLDEGVLTADVRRQPGGRPMVLTTPAVEVAAQETRFSFTRAGDAARVDTEQGRLQVTRKSDGASIEVPVGSYAVAAPGLAPMGPYRLPASFTRPRLTLPEDVGPVQTLAWSPDGKLLATAGWDGNVRLWDAGDGSPRGVLALGKQHVRSLAFSPDGLLLAAASDEKVVRVWETPTGRERYTLAGLKAKVHAVAFSPDGMTLATADAPAGKLPAEVRLWDALTGQDRGSLGVLPRDPLTLAYSPDGMALAAGLADGVIRQWEPMTGRELLPLVGHAAEVRALAFSPDGKQLASASKDHTARLWDPVTGQGRLVGGDKEDVRSVAYSPDGMTLAVGANGLVRLWDLVMDRERATFKAHKQAVGGVAFAPDGGTLATAGWDKTVKLWDAVGDGGRRAP